MKRCHTTFHGPGVTISEGTVLTADAPVVKAFPDMFEEASAQSERSAPVAFGPGGVEVATARPGEMRNVTPPKSAAKKSATKKG